MSNRLQRLAVVAIIAVLAAAGVRAADLTGTWNFTWETEGGVRESALEIKQAGDALTARMGEAELTGSIKETAFELSGKLYSAEAGATDVLKIDGRVEGERLTGKASWGAHPMTFTAVRAK